MQKFRRIGAGLCGTVWAESSDAFKREDGEPGRSLSNDFDMHQRVIQSLQQLQLMNQEPISTILTVPACHRFITPADDWWDTNLRKFPEGYVPCNAIHAERIPPMSQAVRELLIDTYCPPSIIAEIKASDTNKDCLIRPYLGRRRVLATSQNGDTSSRRPPRPRAFFSLRNFPLHVDQMEQLGIQSADMETFAKGMANALATMHFNAGIDANDVEFVLAPPPTHIQSPSSEQDDFSVISNILGTHTMWILDFDCCGKISMDNEKGLDQVIMAFLRNDPFYPRPSSSEHLWRVFRDEYLLIAREIIQSRMDVDKEGLFAFAMRFVEGVEEREMRKMRQRGSSSQKVSYKKRLIHNIAFPV